MKPHCSACGCLLLYRAQARQKSQAASDWVIAYRCPGCGSHGGYGDSYAREEAEAIAAAQNDRAGTPDAAKQAAKWKQTVRRRAENDARRFADYFVSRFPDWKSHVRFIELEETNGAGDPNDLEWYCALLALLPSENPQVDAPLEVRVLNREVRLTWGDFWHTHVYADFAADSADPEHLRPEHLHRAVAEVEAIMTEQILVCACYREGRYTSGCILPAGREPTPPWTILDPAHPACGHQMIVRSWRGTLDRIIKYPGARTLG